jgi:hypothetical protein
MIRRSPETCGAGAGTETGNCDPLHPAKAAAVEHNPIAKRNVKILN